MTAAEEEGGEGDHSIPAAARREPNLVHRHWWASRQPLLQKEAVDHRKASRVLLGMGSQLTSAACSAWPSLCIPVSRRNMQPELQEVLLGSADLCWTE